MNARSLITLWLCLFLALLPATALAHPHQQTPTDDPTVQQRANFTRGQSLYSATPLSVEAVAASGPELAQALDVLPSLVVAATIEGPAEGSAVFPALGIIQPKLGNTLVVLSTGIAGTNAPEPGVDFGSPSAAGDRVVFTLVLNVPAGTNRLSFDYNFLSAESPDFIGSIFNDTFKAILTDGNGVREIARASVNSSIFIPVSATNAGGSGFDIFTEDPSGVDTSFGGGLPDSGVTGYRNINVAVAGGGQVTLEFSIEDLGDGILDSAVVLDNLLLTALEAVDPNPTLLANGNVISDRLQLAHAGEAVEGAAADGVTKVLLRTKVAGPGSVAFCLNNATAPADGGLALLDATGRNQCVMATVESVGNEFVAFALYQVPEEFNRGGDASLAERPLEFKATYSATSGSTVDSVLPFKLVRPPVMLIHGLWSGPGTWTFPLVTDPRFKVEVANYESTNAAHFANNSDEPGSRIRTALTKLRLNKIAVTQVDVAGHSMGGILSRLHFQSANYKNNLNFNQGDINKLITLNTPHTGSPFGNLIQGIRAIPFVGGAFESAMAYINHPVDRGAIEDLAKGSAAINAIQKTTIPSHALVGIGGSDALELLPGGIGATYTIINFFADDNALFQGLQHDGIVGRESQEGGLSPNAYTVFDGFGSIHTQVTGNPSYSTRIINLYNSPANGVLFEEFPAPSSIALAAAAKIPIPAIASNLTALIADGLVITSPTDGTFVTSGATVAIALEPAAGSTIDQVLVIGAGTAITDSTVPFLINVVIPEDAIGPFPILAFGKNSSGDLFPSNVITLQVTPDATLETLTIVPQDTILFTVGESLDLSLFGAYSDGVIRNVTSSATGTTYFTSDPAIVQITDEGLITAQGPGTATIVARNGSIQNSISVIVLLNNQAPVANAGPDQNVLAGTSVQLNGNGSSDPDNSPLALSYEWSQVAGPTVTLENPLSATPSFLAAEVGSYTFSLIVRDGQADSLPDSITINVTETPPANGTLTVHKQVINDDGGTKAVGDFTLFAGTTQVTSGVPVNLPVGSYQIREEGSFGYRATFGGDCNAQGIVTVAAGTTKGCTITNNDIAPVALRIAANVSGQPGQIARVGLTYTSNGNSASLAAFSVDFDQSCLSFNPADGNNDGIPDAIQINLPADFSRLVQVDLTDLDGELDFTLQDISPPTMSLPNGTLMTIDFQVRNSAACQPTNSPIIAAVNFSAEPTASFGTAAGESLPTLLTNGSVAIGAAPVQLGNCNSDSVVDAGDLSAMILEIFDGDGMAVADVAGGTFPGGPGCDANTDNIINAADLTCTVLRIFNSPNACTIPPNAANQGTAELTIADHQVNLAEEAATVEILLASNGNDVSAVTFVLHYDPSQLHFDTRDNDGDSLPDAINFAFDTNEKLINITGDAGRLAIAVADISATPTSFANGTLVTITFDTKNKVGEKAVTSALTFSSEEAASLGSHGGSSIALTTQNGLLTIIPMKVASQVYLPFVISAK